MAAGRSPEEEEEEQVEDKEDEEEKEQDLRFCSMWVLIILFGR